MDVEKAKARMKEILEDTLQFYSEDPSRRAVIQSGCLYLDPRTGNKCAVGRYMSDRMLNKLSLQGDNTSLRLRTVMGIGRDESIPVLREDAQGFSHGFWNALQAFHDEYNKSDPSYVHHHREQITKFIDTFDPSKEELVY